MANANDGHPPSYQRYPRDLRASLSHETEDFSLRYAWALDASWDDHSYGVGTPDDWCRWARVTPPRREEFLSALRRHTSEMPDGTLVQMRMVSERNLQWAKRKQASEAGRSSSYKRQRSFNGRSTVVDDRSTLASASAVASASAEKEEPTHSGQAAPDPAADQLTIDPDDIDRIQSPREWRTGFEEFWSEYPRKVKRQEAEKAYMKLSPKTDRTFTLLFDGLEHWKRGEWASRSDPSTIEHCSTWLNNGRYRDAEKRQEVNGDGR